MKSEAQETTQTPVDILNELRALVSEAERIIGQAPAAGCDCETTLAALRERMEAAQERCAELYEGTKRKVIAGAQRADATVRENPYQSIAIAVGVGLLAGVLLGRRANPSAR
jgi:ElaB/YqjD/DUF883 family membrane-anchored ribosome-binding protein